MIFFTFLTTTFSETKKDDKSFSENQCRKALDNMIVLMKSDPKQKKRLARLKGTKEKK